MAYGNFKNVEEVARKFDIEVARKSVFVRQKELDVQEALFLLITENIRDNLSFINETTICEKIISPMLHVVAKKYAQLNVWSHVPYNIDEQKGLVGEPDYLIAPRTKYGGMGQPSLCIIEAKRDNFDEGWTQALAEMVASSLAGASLCYGVVTTGKTWEFGKLENGIFTVDPVSVSAADNLQKTFNILNWIFEIIAQLDL
ncbi:Type I restriction enzyme R protein N-terminal domain-containing protein [Candidatus Electrothrix laxa]